MYLNDGFISGVGKGSQSSLFREGVVVATDRLLSVASLTRGLIGVDWITLSAAVVDGSGTVVELEQMICVESSFMHDWISDAVFVAGT